MLLVMVFRYSTLLSVDNWFRLLWYLITLTLTLTLRTSVCLSTLVTRNKRYPCIPRAAHFTFYYHIMSLAPYEHPFSYDVITSHNCPWHVCHMHVCPVSDLNDRRVFSNKVNALRAEGQMALLVRA